MDAHGGEVASIDRMRLSQPVSGLCLLYYVGRCFHLV